MKKFLLKVSLTLVVLFSIVSCTDSAEELLESNNIENLDTFSRIDPDDDGTDPEPQKE